CDARRPRYREGSMIRRLQQKMPAARTIAGAFVLSASVVTLSGMRPAPAPYADVFAGIERAIEAGDPVTLDWKAMAALNYRTGEMPESLRKLNGVEVRIPGFMVPLEDTETRVTEFLLVPYFGACIHTPPPPPNQMVHVMM